MENLLNTLAEKYNTDKKKSVHNYTETYFSIFNEKRLYINNFLEIGILDGSSLKMWRDFFTNAQIYGVDINPNCSKFEDERINIRIGSQDDASFLDSSFLQKNILFDYIIDDGSHISSHQIKSFEFLFNNCLKSGGLYIIEDTCCSYWKSHQTDDDPKKTCIEYFKSKIDEINFYGFIKNEVYDRNNKYLLENYPNPTEFQKKIKSINFLNSLIIIEKF